MSCTRTYTFYNAEPLLRTDIAEDAAWLDIPLRIVCSGFEIHPGGVGIIEAIRTSEALPEVI